MVSKMVYVSNYENGGLYIDDTAQHDVNFSGLLALSAASAATVVTASGSLTTVPLPVGVIVPIRGTSVTLASGKIIALA